MLSEPAAPTPRGRAVEGAASRRLRGSAVVLFVLCALGLSVSVVGDVNSGALGWPQAGGGAGVPLALGVVGLSAACAMAVTITVLRSTLTRSGVRSRARSLALLAIVAYAPGLLLGVGWVAWSAVLACFVLELLPPRPAVVVYLSGLVVQFGIFRAAGQDWGDTVFAGVSYVATSVLLFLVVRSVNTYRELEITRAELAHAEVLAERVRVSRDLHDLLGRNLAAISLKVELARRHHRAERAEAVQSELDEVLALSHAAAADLRALVAGFRLLTIASEMSAAVRLLTDAGVRCEVDGEPSVESGPSQEVLAWALREAATNVVKHSNAQRCTLAVRRRGSELELLVENDGVVPGTGTTPGAGLVGVRERVQALGGRVSVSSGEGVFRLVCTVPGTVPRVSGPSRRSQVEEGRP